MGTHLDKKEVSLYRESTIFGLAHGASVELVLDTMERNAQENNFVAAEGIRQGVYDWFGSKDRLNCRAVALSNGERVDINFSADYTDDIDDYDIEDFDI